jgi:FAD/FMN-containing dehydrogenase
MTPHNDSVQKPAVTLSPDNLNALRTMVRGPVMVPGEAGYDESRTIWNGMIDRRPSLIVRCIGTADVVAGVNFARDQGIPLTIKGGGHNIAGLAVSDNSMMLDMSLMKGVWVDTEKNIAHAQAGCTLGDVDRETQLHGLAAVLGFVSNTGIAGLTLGGGFGYLTRQHGWSSDNVVGIDVVTADGRRVRASDTENVDLFWGLRGGGGNFGVATGFDYRLYNVGPDVTAGAIAWPGEDAPQVLELYRKLVQTAPPELVVVAALRKAPPAPWIDSAYHGKLIVALFVIHSGSLEEGSRAVAPIKAFGKPVGDVLQKRPYCSQQTLLDATQPNGRRYYWKSEYLPGLDDGLIEKFIEYGQKIVSPHSAMLLFPLDGSHNKLPADHSAVGNRDAKLVLNLAGSWESSADDDANIGWARDAWSDMKAYSTGGTYINFLTEEEGDDRIGAAFRSNLDRLIEVKRKWDPTNMFCMNKNIAPGM